MQRRDAIGRMAGMLAFAGFLPITWPKLHERLLEQKKVTDSWLDELNVLEQPAVPAPAPPIPGDLPEDPGPTAQASTIDEMVDQMMKGITMEPIAIIRGSGADLRVDMIGFTLTQDRVCLTYAEDVSVEPDGSLLTLRKRFSIEVRGVEDMTGRQVWRTDCCHDWEAFQHMLKQANSADQLCGYQFLPKERVLLVSMQVAILQFKMFREPTFKAKT
jgi:hypothetical protein